MTEERRDGERHGGGMTRRIVLTIVAAFALLLAIPVAIGFASAHYGGEARDASPWGLAAGLIVAVSLTVWSIRSGLRAADRRSTAGPGEAAERARRRGFWAILGALFVSGMAVGMGAAVFEIEPGGFLTGRLPAWFALVAAVATVLAMTVGTALFLRRVDEVEREDNIWASAVGGNALLIVYPGWFLLWKGGWVAEPSHVALVLLTFATMTIAYGYRKFR